MVGIWTRLEGPPEQGHTFLHAREAVPGRSGAGRGPGTVVADGQADGLDVTGHQDVDPGGVACVTLGVGDRLYRRIVRKQQFERVRFHERDMLARELHDTVAHRVSAIAIQAQAGQVLATSGDLGGAVEAWQSSTKRPLAP